MHVEVHLFINLVIRALKDDSQSNDKKVHEGFQAIERVAEAHGRHLVTLNFPPSEVAHYYGAICQSVMGIAAEESCCFPAKEYEIFNQCLDHGIAGAICGLQDGAIQEHAPDTE